MPETFLLLLCGGVMLASAIPNPRPASIQTSRVFLRLLLIVAALFLIGAAKQGLASPSNVPPAAAIVGCAGVSAMGGVILFEWLISRAALRRNDETFPLLRRINLIFAGLLLLRMFFALCATLMETRWPIEAFWRDYGLLIAMRWLFGLLLPSAFVFNIHQHLVRQAKQRAANLITLTSIFVIAAELIAINLTRLTGLPF